MQRLALARALVKDGDVFIFDEPDSFLDKNYIEKLIEIIYSYREEKIILIVTHNRRLMEIADKIIRI